MSATPEEVEKFLRNGSTLASKVTGSVAGAAIGTIFMGPPGAIIGAALAPFFEHHLTALAGEFVTRQMGSRQQLRAGAGTLLLATAVQAKIVEGHELRKDGFDIPDETGRRPIDELAEQAIMSMVNSVEERRLPYLANLYASLYFDESISRTSIATLVAVAGSLNFRAMCILNILGKRTVYTGQERGDGIQSSWPTIDHMVAKEAFSLIGNSVIVAKSDDNEYHSSILGYMDLEPGILQLGSIGLVLYEKMGLAEMPFDLPDLLDTRESLERIALAASENWEFNGGSIDSLPIAPAFERVFSEVDWSSTGTEFFLLISAVDHGRGATPSPQVSSSSESGGYEHVTADIQTDSDGNVRIGAARPFAGRVLIR